MDCVSCDVLLALVVGTLETILIALNIQPTENKAVMYVVDKAVTCPVYRRKIIPRTGLMCVKPSINCNQQITKSYVLAGHESQCSRKW